MHTITIQWVLAQAQGSTAPLTVLGEEHYHDITEALVPKIPPAAGYYPVYATKRFSGYAHHVWEVLDVQLVGAVNDSPLVYQVHVVSGGDGSEVFLNQTLRKNKDKALTSILQLGTLVEVDYGFENAAARFGHGLKTSKRYPDGLQKGEVYKRRLAVVYKVLSRDRVVVLPVTSIDNPSKSKVEVSPESTTDLKRYGNSDVKSYMLCDVPQAVSVRRILPPVSKGPRGFWNRNSTYKHKLCSFDLKQLKEALGENYADALLKKANTATELAEKKAQKATDALLAEQAKVAALKSQIDALRGVANMLLPMAKDLAEMNGCTVAEMAGAGYDESLL